MRQSGYDFDEELASHIAMHTTSMDLQTAYNDQACLCAYGWVSRNRIQQSRLMVSPATPG